MGFGVKVSEISDLITAAHDVTDALVAVVDGVVDDVQAQTDKLAGETPAKGSVTADWQSDTGTSGETGADLVSIGSAGNRKKVHSLVLNIGALTAGAIITIKLFMLVNDVETKVYPPAGTTWTVDTDPNGIWVVNGTLEIAGVMRVEVESDTPADNDKAISYEYDLEAM